MKLSFLERKTAIFTTIASILTLVSLVVFSPSHVNAAQPIACPLRGGAGDTLVNFYSGKWLLGNSASTSWYADYNVNIPPGRYKVVMTTYDDHSSHGGQNQRDERVYVSLYNRSGGSVIGRTNSTVDVPENADVITTTIANSLTLNSAARVLRTVHAAYPNGSTPESVLPICVLFERLDSPTPPATPIDGVCGTANGTTVSSLPTGSAACQVGTYNSGAADTNEEYLWNCVGSNGGTTASCYANRLQDDDINVTCSVSDTYVEVGDTVTWTGRATGGTGGFTYSWSGAVIGTGSTRSRTFSTPGTYTATVIARDSSGNTASRTCASVVVEDEEEDDFDITCRVTDTSIYTDERITFSVSIDGGRSPFRYRWTGDIEDEDDDTRTLRVSYDEEGTYRVRVTVTDDYGERASATCPSIRVRDDGSNRVVRVTTEPGVPTGQLASLDSVFLNQVPVTGVDDARKIALFVSFLTVWSMIVGAFFYNRHQKSLRSSEIAQFKASNRNR